MKLKLARWYMGRIASRYCPCEWPIRSKRLIRLCGRIDDLYVADEKRKDLIRFIEFHTGEQPYTTSSNAQNVTVRWTRK
jgi:hypothetical protein